MKFSDEELMVMFAAGTTEAFDMIYDRYRDRIYRFALSCLGSTPDAEDAVQEVFLSMARSAARYQPRNRFKSWIFQIAGNSIRDIAGRENIRRSRFTFELHLADDDERHIRMLEARDELSRMMAGLNPSERILLMLKEFEGLDVNAIAEITGISPGNVRVKVHRARHKLRALSQSEER